MARPSQPGGIAADSQRPRKLRPAALGPSLAGRMRRLFFERELETAFGLSWAGRPCRPQVWLLPLASEAGATAKPLVFAGWGSLAAAGSWRAGVSERRPLAEAGRPSVAGALARRSMKT